MTAPSPYALAGTIRSIIEAHGEAAAVTVYGQTLANTASAAANAQLKIPRDRGAFVIVGMYLSSVLNNDSTNGSRLSVTAGGRQVTKGPVVSHALCGFNNNTSPLALWRAPIIMYGGGIFSIQASLRSGVMGGDEYPTIWGYHCSRRAAQAVEAQLGQLAIVPLETDDASVPLTPGHEFTHDTRVDAFFRGSFGFSGVATFSAVRLRIGGHDLLGSGFKTPLALPQSTMLDSPRAEVGAWVRRGQMATLEQQGASATTRLEIPLICAEFPRGG